MKQKTILMLAALLAAFALLITGCGTEEAPETTEAPKVTMAAEADLGLASWEMSASTWSSPNGATVHITATPNSRTEDQYAVFTVRLEGDDVQIIPCTWNGTSYTASADLNAADGYCYYVTLTTVDGKQAEIPVNTPASPVNDSLIHLETSLNTYCHLLVGASEADAKKLTITDGTVQIQPPQIANDGQAITCTDVVLVLNFNGQEAGRQALSLPAAGENGSYTFSIAGTAFDLPAMEDDQQLTLRLDVTLSNGQVLTDANGTWSWLDGQLVSAVG